MELEIEHVFPAHPPDAVLVPEVKGDYGQGEFFVLASARRCNTKDPDSTTGGSALVTYRGPLARFPNATTRWFLVCNKDSGEYGIRQDHLIAEQPGNWAVFPLPEHVDSDESAMRHCIGLNPQSGEQPLGSWWTRTPVAANPQAPAPRAWSAPIAQYLSLSAEQRQQIERHPYLNYTKPVLQSRRLEPRNTRQINKYPMADYLDEEVATANSLILSDCSGDTACQMELDAAQTVSELLNEHIKPGEPGADEWKAVWDAEARENDVPYKFRQLSREDEIQYRKALGVHTALATPGHDRALRSTQTCEALIPYLLPELCGLVLEYVQPRVYTAQELQAFRIDLWRRSLLPELTAPQPPPHNLG